MRFVVATDGRGAVVLPGAADLLFAKDLVVE